MKSRTIAQTLLLLALLVYGTKVIAQTLYRLVAYIPSFLSETIDNIIFWGSNKKVVGSDAWSVITRMADKHSFWNWPIVKFPRQAMCLDHFTFIRQPDGTIATTPTGDSRSRPKPTLFCFFYEGPKSFHQWLSYPWILLVAFIPTKFSKGMRGWYIRALAI